MTDLVVTHSLLKSFRRCPRISLYKHQDLLAPREVSKPLKKGTWMHELLEAYYNGDDWKEVHKRNTAAYSKLFDEEKEKLGDLPTECAKLMRSYLWHYRNDESWIVHDVEFKLTAELPSGVKWQGKSDMLVEDENGLWIVDHKNHAQIPSHTQRLLDQQSVLYIWAARRNGIPVTGFIWNYLKTKAPAEVRITKAGTIARNQGQTDYPTAYASIVRQVGKGNIEPYKPFLRSLVKQRYVYGEVQTSPWFLREVFEKNDQMIERAVVEADRTATRYKSYDWEDRDSVERVPDRSCDWCGYKNLCTVELIGGNADNVKRTQFQEQDPFAYYGESDDPIKEDR